MNAELSEGLVFETRFIPSHSHFCHRKRVHARQGYENRAVIHLAVKVCTAVSCHEDSRITITVGRETLVSQKY